MKRNLLRYVSLNLGIAILLSTQIQTTALSQVAVDYGKSYVNITKGLNGGTIEPGDTLEMRSTFVVRCTGSCTNAYVDSVAYYDTVKTGMLYVANSLAVLTNEGKIYKSFTDAAGDDCGSISGSNIRINLGYNTTDNPATAFRRGRIKNTHKPSLYGSTCIMVASYKVVVTQALGSLINTGGGVISYKPYGASGISYIQFPNNNAMVSSNFGICTNTVGTNALGTEYNGTFGSGKARNRVASGSVPATYTYNIFGVSSPQDYYYGIPNNTSTQTNYTTSNSWSIPDNSSPSHRIFNVWDIIGDHTGAAVPLAGNTAADTVNNSNAGYMLVVNASYRIDSAFTHTISGLCPNTYYEISAWYRNICSKCGCDSNGKGATNSGYIPTATGDSSGVYPNLTIRIDGIDYYTTGNIKYTGKWIKKGFTYVTGPNQTSLTMTIRNNAPGGGGNDWAIDDISLATCTPTLDLTPNGGVNICYGNQVDMSTVIRCFSPNYIYWTWERSTDGGATWNATGVSGVGTPVYSGGEWKYSASYPSFLADSSYHNNMFRVRVASTLANLNNSSCSFTASNTIIVWVNNCSVPLDTKIISFKGKLDENKEEHLYWTAENETENVVYEIQRSEDRVDFRTVATVKGTKAGFYNWSEKFSIKNTIFYRLKITEGQTFAYSNIIALQDGSSDFNIKTLINPFYNLLQLEVSCPVDGKVSFELIDPAGRILRQWNENLQKGTNILVKTGWESLKPGVYILRAKQHDKTVNRQLIRK